MYKILDVLVDEEVFEAKFSCDLNRCKGSCCTFPSDNGAPLLDEEIEKIKKVLPTTKKYLSKRSLDIINTEGFYIGIEGEYATNSIDRKDCVFVYWEGDVAKCAIEKAYFNGDHDFRKPISCHLFPIRVGNFGGKYLYYEKFKECKPAIIKGNNKNIKLVDSLKDSITRAYGDEVFQVMKKVSDGEIEA